VRALAEELKICLFVIYLASVYTSIVVLAFLVTTFLFLIYERLVTKREKTKNAALKVVSSMFPSNVHEKILKGAQDRNLGNSDEENLIASFYPATTVLFGMSICPQPVIEPYLRTHISLLFFLIY
jgi:hypothetical protein